jgi:phospholipid/cholesterol/gamma-HCH transport system permease protein
MKPLVFAVIIATVGCYYGMQTTGGTQGVGRSTTRAVVTSSVWVFIANVFITRFFVNLK